MRDYYSDGFGLGYKRENTSCGDYPPNDGDDYSYRKGFEEGIRRRKIADELDDWE